LADWELAATGEFFLGFLGLRDRGIGLGE